MSGQYDRESIHAARNWNGGAIKESKQNQASAAEMIKPVPYNPRGAVTWEANHLIFHPIRRMFDAGPRQDYAPPLISPGRFLEPSPIDRPVEPKHANPRLYLLPA